MITEDITPIQNNIDSIDLCNGYLCEIDLEKYLIQD
jgi:hypothetical protein